MLVGCDENDPREHYLGTWLVSAPEILSIPVRLAQTVHSL